MVMMVRKKRMRMCIVDMDSAGMELRGCYGGVVFVSVEKRQGKWVRFQIGFWL